MDDNQMSLFVCEVMDFGFRDDIASMESPMFSLASGRKPDMTPKYYEHNGEKIEIKPSSDGHATIFDKDILLYCISYLMEAINRGEEVSRRVRIIMHDFLRTTYRTVGGGSYKLVENALDRLKGTQIKSTFIEKVIAESEGRKVTKNFKKITSVGLVESWKIVLDQNTGAMESIDIILPEWLFINVQKGAVLKINPEYFRLRRGLDRRLYEIGRKHVGNQKSWQIGVDLLHKKSGSTANIRKFRHMLAMSIQKSLIPDFNLKYVDKSRKSVKFISVPDSSLKVFDARPLARKRAEEAKAKKEDMKKIVPLLVGGGFACPICQKVCKSKGGFGSHIRTHS